MTYQTDYRAPSRLANIYLTGGWPGGWAGGPATIDPEVEYLLGLPLDHYTTDDGDTLTALWAKPNPTD